MNQTKLFIETLGADQQDYEAPERLTVWAEPPKPINWREAIIVTALMLAVFAALMLIGFPLRFDGAMPWDLWP